MNMLDLLKATLVCGGLAFVIYSFPVVSQISLITLLTLLWLLYARKAFISLRQRSGVKTP